MNQTDISVLPSLNPDGFDRATEGECSGSGRKSGANNEENIDINRDFPTWDDLHLSKSQMMAKSQPETAAVIVWVLSHP